MWKSTWRRWARAQPCTAASSARIAAVLDGWLPVGASIAAYRALPEEPALDAIVDGRRRWLSPRVEGRSMTFHDWDSQLETVTFGLRQPTVGSPVVPGSEIDVMVIPGLAFDRTGIRLGRGAGYYDRYLAAHPNLATVAVAPWARIVERLPAESHDQRVRYLATESGVIPVRPSG